MHLLSNQTVTNPGRVASFIMILVPSFQWTGMNRPRASWMSFTSSLFVIIFTVDWLSSIDFPDTWVLFLLFRN